MRPILYKNSKLYAFDRDTYEFFIIAPELVSVRKLNGFIDYFALNTDRRLIITQAINEKRASAKMLTLLNIYKTVQNDKHRAD